MTISNENQLFKKARNETISYHKLYYSRHKLFQEDSWLAKPDAGLMQLLQDALIPRARNGQAVDLKILDLGCGVGRNAVPMAMALKEANLTAQPNAPLNAKIIAVDVLAESIDLLAQNSAAFGVEHIIEGLLEDNDQFVIEPQSYDLIAAISVVEHCAGRAKVLKLLKAIARGLKPNGLARIEMTTDRNVIDLATKQAVPTHVETPLSERQVKEMLEEAFQGLQTISLDCFPYKEVLDKDNKKILWQSKQITFSARAIE